MMTVSIILFCTFLLNTITTESEKFKCEDLHETTSLISNIHAGNAFAANKLVEADNNYGIDEFTKYMTSVVADDFYCRVVINDESGQKLQELKYNGATEYLNGNSVLPSHGQLLLNSETRSVLSTPACYFQCEEVEGDKDDTLISNSYYTVKYTKKTTSETYVSVNFVETHWRYSRDSNQWLMAKSLFTMTSPSFPSDAGALTTVSYWMASNAKDLVTFASFALLITIVFCMGYDRFTKKGYVEVQYDEDLEQMQNLK